MTESSSGGPHLRLIWPQWQGGGTSSVRELASEFPFDVARRGYAVGSTVLDAVLPPHDGPSVAVPVSMSNEGLEERDGIEAKTVILDQLAQALKVIAQHDPARITTLGGECSVSVAPFAALLTDTATTSRSCGLTPIPTSAPASANIPGTTRWPSPRSLVEPILRCKPSYRRPFRRTGWRLSACTRGPTMITPTSLPGAHILQPRRPTRVESAAAGLAGSNRLHARGRSI